MQRAVAVGWRQLSRVLHSLLLCRSRSLHSRDKLGGLQLTRLLCVGSTWPGCRVWVQEKKYKE